MNITGKIFEFENEKYKVIAQKGMDIVVAENVNDNSAFKGDIEFLYDAVVVGDVLKCPKSQYFATTKEKMYSKIEEKVKGKVKRKLFKKEVTPPIDVSDTEALVKALGEDYRKTPSELLKLVVTAYQNNM